MSVEETECFRQTEDGVLLSKNLVERMLYRGTNPQFMPMQQYAPPASSDDMRVEVETECSDIAKINLTQPLKPASACQRSAPSKSVSQSQSNHQQKDTCLPCTAKTKILANDLGAKRLSVSPNGICGELQEALVQCYQDNPGQPMNCAQLVRDLRKCIYEPSGTFLSNSRQL